MQKGAPRRSSAGRQCTGRMTVPRSVRPGQVRILTEGGGVPPGRSLEKSPPAHGTVPTGVSKSTTSDVPWRMTRELQSDTRVGCPGLDFGRYRTDYGFPGRPGTGPARLRMPMNFSRGRVLRKRVFRPAPGSRKIPLARVNDAGTVSSDTAPPGHSPRLARSSRYLRTISRCRRAEAWPSSPGRTRDPRFPRARMAAAAKSARTGRAGRMFSIVRLSWLAAGGVQAGYAVRIPEGYSVIPVRPPHPL